MPDRNPTGTKPRSFIFGNTVVVSVLCFCRADLLCGELVKEMLSAVIFNNLIKRLSMKNT
jgi:hypothetical protein